MEENIRTIDDLNSYMLKVVRKEIPSPIYGYEHPNEENSDNDWWTDDNESYLLLILLNEIGLITFNSQHGKFEEGDIGEGRSYVTFLIEDNQKNRSHVENLKDKGFLTMMYKFQDNKWVSQDTTIQLVRSLGRLNCNSFSHSENQDSIFDYFDYMEDSIKDKLTNSLMMVTIADNEWRRPATHLFTEIYVDFNS